MAKKYGWFQVGYEEGLAGKPEKCPESFQARQSYRPGWAAGDLDRSLAAAGNQPKGLDAAAKEWGY